MGKETSFAEYKAGLNPVNAQIIRQYRAVTGIFDLFWTEVSVRTNKNAWRQDSQRVGSCVIEKDTSEGGLCGPAMKDIIALRELRNQEVKGFQFGDACLYHRLGRGCILGNLKSPLCLNHVDFDHGSEMRSKLRFSPFDMNFPLVQILLGGDRLEKLQVQARPSKKCTICSGFNYKHHNHNQ